MAEEYLVSLETLARGAAVERFSDALARVIDNVLDVNTKPDQKREITLKITITPTITRNMASVNIGCETKLAAPIPVGTQIYVGKRAGRAVATEYNPEQLSMEEAFSGVGRIPPKNPA